VHFNRAFEESTMKRLAACGAGLLTLAITTGTALAQDTVVPTERTDDVIIREAKARYLPELELIVFEQILVGQAGATVPAARGAMDGAPVLAYVFPTTLRPENVGFGPVEGIVALVATSHPDFDDTPLWDEAGDGRYDNDGAIFHTHWVVLNEDDRVPGGLAVREIGDEEAILPPTNPGMPMYMDSPGLTVVLQGDTLRILVPAWRIRHALDFRFDAVTAYLEVNTSDETRPLLGVYEVYDVASGDLSLPYTLVHGDK